MATVRPLVRYSDTGRLEELRASDSTPQASTFETINKNLNSTGATFVYSGGNLQSITYLSGVVKTLNYASGVLTSVVLSGATPSAIALTKTFTYTSGNLTQVTYS